MEVSQTKNKFLVFTAYRAILFGGLCAVLLFVGIFGPALWRHYFGDSGAFYYNQGELAVHYIDVGQGDCVAIKFPDGKILVMDSGEEMYYSRVKTYLETRVLGENQTIDYLIATHSHSDHVGGFANMLRDFDVKVVYRPHNISLNDPEADLALGPPTDTLVYDRFINAAYNSQAEVRFIIAGEEIADVAFSYSFYFHTPTLELFDKLSASRFDDFNEVSPITSLRYLDHVFVFTGDAGLDSEKLFLKTAGESGFTFSASDIVYLKVGHHGSKTATSMDFLEFIMPDKAVISLGARNTYGFPHAQVTVNLKDAGLSLTDIFMTSEYGNIAVVTGTAGERLYYAFDNKADLTLLWILGFVTVFVVCFTGFKRKI